MDILAIFKSNEPDTIRRMGFDVTLWDPADFGVPTLGLTYITREELANSDSDKVERFLKATMKALEYARDNRDEAIEIVMKYAPEEDPAHQRFMLDTEFDGRRQSAHRRARTRADVRRPVGRASTTT